ncbi:MAG TPA: hypothetical protein VGM25_16735 [Caulobacteraceae bacterium]|jgi:hypothetical protein
MTRIWRRFRIAGYLAAGPITGLLLAGFVRHHRKEPLLAALYLAAIPSAWVLLTLTAAGIVPHG